MLSRANSTASSPLRRTKSVNSVHTTSTTGRTATSITDAKTQAGAAAAEAFLRAQENMQYASVSNQPTTNVHRRKSTRKGAEGSHFEAARQGKRRSKDPPRRSQAVQQEPAPRHVLTSSVYEDGSSVLRPQPPPHHDRAYQRIEGSQLPKPQPSSVARRSSTTIHGSPTPRRQRDIIQPDPELPPLPRSHPPAVTSRLPSATSIPSAPTISVKSPRSSIRATQTDEDILNVARDAYLQDFHQNKLRERKSFLGSYNLKKWRPNTAQSFTRDSSLPPFNCADEIGEDTFRMMIEEDPVLSQVDALGKGSRRGMVFTGSIKDRIRSMLRKTPRSTSCLPPQQVKATQSHCLSMHEHGTNSAQPTMVSISHVPSSSRDSSAPEATHVSQSGDQSRLTSWTNSTVIAPEPEPIQPEQQPYPPAVEEIEAEHVPTLRNKASFLLRATHNKLRKPSRADMRVSTESRGLFAALQSLIHPGRNTEQTRQASKSSDASKVDSVIVGMHSAETLSQTLAESINTVSSTIRTVTPEQYREFRAMSPVVEAASPATVSVSQLQMVKPSADQIASRVQRAQDRWRSSLRDHDAVSRYREDNPYVLSPLAKPTIVQDEHATDMPHHAKVGNHAPPSQIISPSIYSRRTDSATPRRLSPEKAITTMVTITGREVKQYPLPSRGTDNTTEEIERPIEVSAQWRKWLTGELRGFSASSVMSKIPAVELPQTKLPSDDVSAAKSSNNSESMVSSKDDQQTSEQPSSGSVTPPSQINVKKHVRKARPRPATRRRSSLMNDRYPMMESSRASSRQSGQSRQTSRVVSSSSEQDGAVFTEPASSTAAIEDGQVFKPRSAASGKSSEIVSIAVESGGASHVDLAKKSQSNNDLRARFRNGISGQSRPLTIDRKSAAAAHSLITDDTVQHITAGPYAHGHQLVLGGRENTPPTHHDDRLPAMSSSQWLARPGMKTRKSDGASVDDSSRQPTKSLSPGQRFATGWLQGRASRSPDQPAAFL